MSGVSNPRRKTPLVADHQRRHHALGGSSPWPERPIRLFDHGLAGILPVI